MVMMWRELVRICSGGGGHRTTGEVSAIGNESSSRSSRSDAGTGATGTALGSNSGRDAVVSVGGGGGTGGGNNSNSEYFLPTSGSFS